MNSLLETLNVWADYALRFAWPMLWQSSLLIGVLFALDLVLRRKLRASVRYALWLVVVVKVLLPPSLAFPTGPSWWLRPAQVASARPHPSPVVVTYGADEQPALPSVVTPVVLAPSRPRLSPSAWTFLGMAAVSLGLVAWMLVRWYQVARDARRATAAPAWLGELLHEPGKSTWNHEIHEAHEMTEIRCNQGAHSTGERCPSRKPFIFRVFGVFRGLSCCFLDEWRRPARIRLTDRPQSPAVCGLFCPVILLPRALADHLPPAQLRAVLLHELVHLRRGDVWVNCLQALVQILYWWHPLFWLANARIRRVREEAVDDAVMLALREEAETYAPTLLEVAKLSLSRPLASLGLVGILESRSSLRQRIERLLDFRPPRRVGLTLGSALAVVGFAAVAVPMGEGPAALHEVRNDRNGPLFLSLSPSEGERVPKTGEGLVLAPDARQGALAAAQGSSSAASRVVTNGSVSNGLSSPSQGRQSIIAMLDRIRFDSVSFDGLPLSQVVRFLVVESQKRDPEKRGINFLLNQNSGGDITAATSVLGPDARLAPPPEDISAVVIKINPPLINIRLADVLDAIVKVADQPIKYTIEDYAIVFSPKSPETTPLYVRTFKVDTNAFLAGLRNAEPPDSIGVGRGIELSPRISSPSPSVGDRVLATTLTADSPRFRISGLHRAEGTAGTSGAQEIMRALMNHVARLGVDLDPERNPAKAVFYDHRKSRIVVRATMQDLDIIGRVVAELNAAPSGGPSGIRNVNPSHSTTNGPQSSVGDSKPVKPQLLRYSGTVRHPLGGAGGGCARGILSGILFRGRRLRRSQD